jgi:thiol:disulfide interchange protein DsbD
MILGAGLLILGLLQMGSLPAGQAEEPGELPLEFPAPTVNAYLSHAALAPGGSGTLLVTLEVAPTFHVQINDFLEILLPEDSPFSLGPWVATELQIWHEEHVLAGKTALKFPITVKEDAPPGPIEIASTFCYQGCVEAPTYACYPPGEVPFALSIEILPEGGEGQLAHTEIFAAHGGLIAGGPAAAATPGDTGEEEVQEPRDLTARLEGALASGSLLAFLLVFVGGILSSFTPCVYPMIPITISFVGGRARSRMHGFVLSLFFVLGIAIMYSALGLVAASTGSIFGAAMQSTAVMVVVAIIFVAMGASMLGAFDLTLPSSMQGKMAAGAQKGGIIGAILMGMVTGVVASPCIGPVLVVLLTFVAKSGSLLMGFWLLFTYACGLGMLFLVLGTFAGAISALPGAGAWMDTVKHVFGVVLIGMAIFFLRTVLGAQFTRFLVGVYLVLVGVFMGALTPLSESPPAGRLLRKSIGILIFISGTLIFLLWLTTVTGAAAVFGLGTGGHPAGIQAASGVAGIPGAPGGTPAASAHPGPAWRINDAGALEDAKAAGKPAVQDFYADWCAACVELDEKTWSDPAVIEEAQRFVAIKMDFTKRGEFSKTATARHAVRGMPTVIFYDSGGNEVTRFFGFKDPAKVLDIMRTVK